MKPTCNVVRVRAEEPTLRKRKPRTTTKEAEKRAAILVLDRGIDLEEAAKLAGLKSIQPVKTSVAREEGRREILAELHVDPATLSMSAKQKLEVAIRQAERVCVDALQARLRRLDQEVHERVAAETAEHLTKLRELQAAAQAERELYQELINGHQPVLSEDQWTVLRRVAHPDNSASAEVRALAFQIINSKKLQLTGRK